MNKEIAVNDFVNMIQASWTWKRLTNDERKRFMDLLILAQNRNDIKGTYEQRRNNLHLMYEAFLQGCKYEPIGWRE